MNTTSDLPEYDSVRSRKEHIKKLETLMKLKEDRKRFREVYRIYKAGIKEDLLQNVKALEKAKEETRAEEELNEEDSLKVYEDLGLFMHRDHWLPSTWIFSHTIKDKKAEFKINDRPVVVDPIEKVLKYKDVIYPLEPYKMVRLLKGEPYLEGYTAAELQTYQKLMKAVGASMRAARQRNINRVLAGYAHDSSDSLTGDDLEQPPTSPTSSDTETSFKTIPHETFGKGLKNKDPVIFLSDDPNELFERLRILIAAKEEGHNKVFNEKHAILKRLLEKKFITKQQYKLLASH